MKKLFISISLSVFLISANVSAKEVPSAGEMFIDMSLVRPLAFTATVVGLGLFVVPGVMYFFMTNPKQTAKNSFYRLVGYPAQYTFTRPLGEFPGYMETREFAEE
jgi:hypothetical protein